MNFLDCINVNKSFGKTPILKGINFSLEKGEQCSIVGASGSGKSTLLYLMGGLDKPDSGEISINNHSLSRLDDEALAKFRNQNIGFVFQFHFLLPTMSCLQNILLPATIRGGGQGEVKERVMHYANILGVEKHLKKYPYELSGGEQQRVNLIRALSLSPAVLLCDEPTGNLDSANSKLVADFLFKFSENEKTTLVVVTHDSNIASRFTRKIKIEDGLIIS